MKILLGKAIIAWILNISPKLKCGVETMCLLGLACFFIVFFKVFFLVANILLASKIISCCAARWEIKKHNCGFVVTKDLGTFESNCLPHQSSRLGRTISTVGMSSRKIAF